MVDIQQAAPAPLLSGPWAIEAIDAFLSSAVIPVRLATNGRGGPLVQSMWFLWNEGRLWCATQESAVIVHRLQADPTCGFEVAGDLLPYRGVRGQGQAELIEATGRDVLNALIERYLGGSQSGLAQWLLSRSEDEVAIAIRPAHMATWDFRTRMQD